MGKLNQHLIALRKPAITSLPGDRHLPLPAGQVFTLWQVTKFIIFCQLLQIVYHCIIVYYFLAAAKILPTVYCIAICIVFQIQPGAQGGEGGGVFEPHLRHLVCLGGSPQLWHR